MATPLDTEVLIVGAGPTGLMLANQLARHGLQPMLIDRHTGPTLQTRALGVQARTLELYARLGIVERALELGRPATGANLWANGHHSARVPFSDAGEGLSPYPYILILGQDDNERLLGDKLRETGQQPLWQHELLALQPHDDHVVATLRGADGSTQTLRAGWVAGCDGARSAVRTLSGIAFPGAPYEQVFFVADVQARGTMKPGEVNVYLFAEGFHLFFPMRGVDHWRIVGILPPALRDRDDLAFDDVHDAVRGQAGDALEVRACSWFSTYRIHHRRAERFRAGRCFVLGDAAHIHSPVGAQGMNTGLQDAVNWAGSWRAWCKARPTLPCWTVTRRSACRWPNGCSPPPTARSASSCRVAGGRQPFAPRYSGAWRRWRCRTPRCSSSRFAPCRRSASSTTRAACRARRAIGRPRRRARATGCRG